MPIELPTEKSKPGPPNPKSLVFYGGEKIGKSYAMAQLENALIVDLQDGYRHYSVLKVAPADFNELMYTFTKMIEAGKPYKYLILDPMDRIEDMCEVEATKRYRLSSAGKNFTDKSVCDIPNGYGYRWLRLPFKEIMTAAESAAQYVIYVAHVRDKFIRNEANDSSTVEIDLTKGCGTILGSYSDSVLHATRRRTPDYKAGQPDTKFDLWVSSLSGDKVCGCRPTHLAGKEFIFSAADDKRPRWELIYLPE